MTKETVALNTRMLRLYRLGPAPRRALMRYVAYFHHHPVKFVHAHHADRPHNRRQHQWSTGMKDDAETQPVDAVIQAAKQWQDLETVAEDWELTATYELIPETSWPSSTRRPEYERVYVFHYRPDEQRHDYQRHPNLFDQSWYLKRV